MGVLKVRSNGQWINVGVGGGPLPAGGVLGDILVKQSAAPSDALWGTTMPKLTLGNLTTAQYSTPLTLLASQHATSRRVGITLGDWQILQDTNGTGIKDFGVYVAGRFPVFIGAAGDMVTVPRLKIAPSAGAAGPQLYTDGNYLAIQAVTDMFLDGNIIHIRNAAGSAERLSIQADGRIQSSTASEAFSMPTNGYIAWWAGSRLGYLQGASGGVILASEAGRLQLNGAGGVQLATPMINGYTLSEAPGANTIVCRTANGYVQANYFNMSADYRYEDSPWIVGSTGSDNFLRYYFTLNANKITWGTTSGPINTTKVSSLNSWGDVTFLANPGTQMATLTLHPGGVAGMFRMAINDNRYHCNDSGGAGYCAIIASAFTPGSSERYKQEIVPLTRTLPTLPVNPVATMVRALRPVWYRTREEYSMLEIPPKPDDFDGESWLPPPEDNYIHFCREEGPGNCGHTPDDPCMWRINWMRGQLGFVAEEVEKVLPQLVQLDKDMNPQTIDLGSFIGLAYAMLQELDSRITALEPEAA